MLRTTFQAVLNSFKEEGPKASETSYNLLSFERANLQKELDRYAQKVVAPERSERPADYYPDESIASYDFRITSSSTMPLTFSGKALESIGVNVTAFNTFLRQGSAKLLQVVLLLGLVYILLRRTVMDSVDTEYLTLVIGCVVFVVLQVVLPVISVEYGLLRAFQQSLMLLSLMVVLGTIVMSYALPNKRAKALTPIVVVLLFFVSSTGLITQSLGGYPAQLNLSNDGQYFDNYYVHRADLYGIEWLRSYPSVRADEASAQSRVQSDRFSYSKQQNSLFEVVLANDTYPGLLRRDSYVYLGYANVVKQQATVLYNGNLLTYTYPLEFYNDNKNMLYNNGTSRIYK